MPIPPTPEWFRTRGEICLMGRWYLECARLAEPRPPPEDFGPAKPVAAIEAFLAEQGVPLR